MEAKYKPLLASNAKALLDQGYSTKEISETLRVPESTIRAWIYRYFEPPKRWPKNTVLEAHNLYKQGFRSVDISFMLGIPDSTVRRWVHSKKWTREE